MQSMTGFARQVVTGDWGSITCELRSVNQRYLDINFRLPEALRSLEPMLREQIRTQLSRGKVECNLNFTPGEQSGTKLSLNQPLAQQVVAVHQQLGSLFKGESQATLSQAMLSIEALLRWPGLVLSDDTHLDVTEQAKQVVQQALVQLVAVRQQEGNQLAQFLSAHLAQISAHIAQIKPLLPQALAARKARILERFAEAQLELDDNRLEQEMVLLAQKVDIEEEIQRLTAHVQETQRVVASMGVVGRRLDFLMQELNREANTLGAKSIDAGMTAIVVDIKVLIEQMREQIQNIE